MTFICHCDHLRNSQDYSFEAQELVIRICYCDRTETILFVKNFIWGNSVLYRKVEPGRRACLVITEVGGEASKQTEVEDV